MQSEMDYRLHWVEATVDNFHLDYHQSIESACVVLLLLYRNDATGLSVDYRVQSIPIDLS